MDRIEVLERRVAELEQRLAEVLQRLAEDTSSNTEWYNHCQRRLEMLRSPIPTRLQLVPATDGEPDSTAYREAWLEQMRQRLALITRTR